MAERVFLIVLDSCGIGAEPDCADFGDVPSNNTFRHISASPEFSASTVRRLGMGRMDGVGWLGGPTGGGPLAAVARMRERSRGKDTTIGHWEIAGVVSPAPLPTYPDGFPAELIEAFSRETGRGVLCNKPYSGTEVIRDYGQRHIATGDLIVYTSADSVFQIAAHEDVVPIGQLYEYCRIARRLLKGEHAVGRVIARPFVGEYPNYVRTERRHDFSLEPPKETLLDALCAAGRDVIAVGKITDVFAGRGITESVASHNNGEGMALTSGIAERDFHGLCFVNLVDFDSAYGHRNNVDGYAAAFAAFDGWLDGFLKKLRPDDVLMITADHGCDPADAGTDHTREYTPLLVIGDGIRPVDLGTRPSFSDIGATVADLLGVAWKGDGVSMAEELTRGDVSDDELLDAARAARAAAYAPYSGHAVGAALLSEDGRIYTGCNVENAAYGVTVCAERSAVTAAVRDGARRFCALAVVGGTDRERFTPPCGSCRQTLYEFCDPQAMRIVLSDGKDKRVYTLDELLPAGFGGLALKTE